MQGKERDEKKKKTEKNMHNMEKGKNEPLLKLFSTRLGKIYLFFSYIFSSALATYTKTDGTILYFAASFSSTNRSFSTAGFLTSAHMNVCRGIDK